MIKVGGLLVKIEWEAGMKLPIPRGYGEQGA